MMHKSTLFKKIVVATVTGIVLLMAINLFMLPTKSVTENVTPKNTKILYVGVGLDHVEIESAINEAKDGDTIFIYSKSSPYRENIAIDKPLKLIGENRDTTIIDGGGKGDVVKITADNVSLSNLTLRNGGRGENNLNDASLEITSNNNIISNINCLSTNYGIWIRDSTGNVIENNSCVAKYDGIWLINSRSNVIKNNSMTGCGLVIDGSSLWDFIQNIDADNTVNGKPVRYYKNQIGIKSPSDAGQVILVNCEKCIVSGLNINGVTDGIGIFYSKNNVIKNNKITKTTDFGIRLVKSSGNTIENNICSNNPVGIGFKSGGFWAYDIDADCKHNVIRRNTLSDNNCGILLDSSNENTISKNNFVRNKRNAFFTDSYDNKWHGNYWDDWAGVKHRLLGFFSPKIIWGQKTGLFLKLRPCINIDLKPQAEPCI